MPSIHSKRNALNLNIMKEILTIYLSVIFINTACLAQSEISWGAQAKIGFSNYRPVESGNLSNSLVTYGAGIYSNVPINSHFSFRPQISWLRKGFQQPYNIFSGPGGLIVGSGNHKVVFDYLPVDLTFVYRLWPERTLHPFLQAGARGSVLINSRVIRESTNQTTPTTVGLDNYRRLTIGGLLSIGIEWHRLSVSIEANHDLSTYLNPPPIALFEDLKPKFQWYGISLTYQLRNF